MLALARTDARIKDCADKQAKSNDERQTADDSQPGLPCARKTARQPLAFNRLGRGTRSHRDFRNREALIYS